MNVPEKNKYYVVWKGRQPGIYNSWEETSYQVHGFQGAEFKAFPSLQLAQVAYRGEYSNYIQHSYPDAVQNPFIIFEGPQTDSYCVDAACSGNPGRLEYRGVYTQTGKEIFHRGPYANGTNNIGEFLAIIHILSLLKKMGMNQTVYSDSETAITWVKQKICKTQLRPDDKNQELFKLISRAEIWLAQNESHNEVLKWDSKAWGEIPADYGRK